LPECGHFFIAELEIGTPVATIFRQQCRKFRHSTAQFAAPVTWLPCGDHRRGKLNGLLKEREEVNHVKLGNNVFGDRSDRRGVGLWWNRRHGELYRTGIVFRVPGVVHY
jgi:hypothetical protein